MVHYIKGVTGVKYTPTQRVNQGLDVYARPFEKYKEWDFFILIFFPYYRTKIAKERLWKEKYVGMPYYDDLYTDKELREYRHLIAKEDDSLWKMAKVVVTLSDGTVYTFWFDTNEEAATQVAGIIKEYGLKQFIDLNTWPFSENND